MLTELSLANWLSLHIVVTVVALLLYVTTSHVAHQRRQPAAAIAWILFILLLPYIALPAFLVFGSRKLPRHAQPYRPLSHKAAGSGSWAVDTIAALGQPAPLACLDLSIHRDGHAAQRALFDTIDGAQHSIAVCTFILGADPLGDSVIERLCDKARAGVHVRMLVDGLGNRMAGRPDISRLLAAGGAFALFVPPLHSSLKGRFNLRDHRKLLIADSGTAGARLWSGGRNLAAEYFEGKDGELPWHDLSFDLRGAVVAQAAAIFERDWAFAKQHPLKATATTQHATSGSATAQFIASGPDQPDDTIHALLVTAAYRACSRIALATPYFVPDSSLLMALCLAARRGVDVDLLVPARSNHRLSDFARERALRTLTEAGARVWLTPGMLHGKLALIDDTLALAGSANLDSRSLFLNYEVMMAFHSRNDIQQFADWFEQERAPAHAYVAGPPGMLRDIAEGMLLWIGFQI
jgi:cardiolipin synthase